MKAKSPAMQLISLAWSGACGGPSFSWTAYNGVVRQACHMAAGSFRWEAGDLDRLCEFRNGRYSIAKCLGAFGIEGLYATAVRGGNATFYTEFERFIGREPLIVDNVNGRKRDRLCVGSEFEWKGEQVKVTSFRKDGSAIACVYSEPDYKTCKACGMSRLVCGEKLHGRYVIDRGGILADRAEKKETPTD